MGVNGFFTIATPHVVIITVLLAGGFFRSLEFTAINALAYADIGNREMSRATSFASVAQQVSLSLGRRHRRADPPGCPGCARRAAHFSQADFALAFWIVAAIGAISVLWFLRLPEGAGAELAAVPGRVAIPAEATAPQ